MCTLTRLHKPLGNTGHTSVKSLRLGMVAVCLMESLLSLSLKAVSLLTKSLGNTLTKLWSMCCDQVASVSNVMGLLRFSVSVFIASQVKRSFPSFRRWCAGIALRGRWHRVADR